MSVLGDWRFKLSVNADRVTCRLDQSWKNTFICLRVLHLKKLPKSRAPLNGGYNGFLQPSSKITYLAGLFPWSYRRDDIGGVRALHSASYELDLGSRKRVANGIISCSTCFGVHQLKIQPLNLNFDVKPGDFGSKTVDLRLCCLCQGFATACQTWDKRWRCKFDR